MTREQMISKIETLTGLHVKRDARNIDLKDMLHTITVSGRKK